MARPRRTPPAESHGDRQRYEALQQAGRQVAQNGAQGAGQGAPTTTEANSSPQGAPIPQTPNVFGPSEGRAPRQREPILPQDGLGVLRALYTKYPNEDLRRLLERAAEMQRRGR